MFEKYQPFQQPTQPNPFMTGGFPSDEGRLRTSYTPQPKREPQLEPQPEPIPEYMPSSLYGSPDTNTQSTAAEELSQFKLDGSRILHNLQHSLMGEIYDPTANRWVKIAEPLVSSAGCGRIIQILSFGVGNVDNRLSKIGIQPINDSLYYSRRNLRWDLMLNEIYRKNPNEPLPVSTIRIILEECFLCKEALLKRSVDGFTVKETGKQESVTHTYNHAQDGSGFGIGKIFRS